MSKKNGAQKNNRRLKRGLKPKPNFYSGGTGTSVMCELTGVSAQIGAILDRG